jgi:hypothetical protein
LRIWFEQNSSKAYIGKQATLDLKKLFSSPRNKGLNILIAVLAVAVLYFSYSLLARNILHPPVDSKKREGGSVRAIQLDLLNGCGVNGAAATFTAYLRARGYDVVEMKNYKTFDVSESLVIARTGNLETAQKVAYALGVKEKNIIQQLNPNFFVDVSVVIGKDFDALKPYQ